MDESGMTLLRDYDGRNVAGWWACEKYDGCRGFWDGRRMWTRGGLVVAMPLRIASQLPAMPLDGELWCGRGNFKAAQNFTQAGVDDERFRFMVFDAPAETGTWAQRLAVARGALVGCEVARVAPCWQLASKAQARELLRGILEAGGEGLVLRSPRARGYAEGRSWTAMRVKKLSVFRQAQVRPLEGLAADCLRELMAV